MTRIVFLFVTLLFFFETSAQEINGNQLLENAIEHHDPNNNWGNFKGKLFITMESPNSSDRQSEITLNLPTQYFKLIWQKDGNKVVQMTTKDSCSISLNGSDKIPEEKIKELRLNCDRTRTMKNYYTYLYGLPMKLRDPGTIIDPIVVRKSFKGKEYLRLKVSYEESVGGDTWYFYFDPKTYAMEVYQFFHDEAKNDGEYILLSDEETANSIKMPKTRAWYYNKDDKYLGTDTLTKTESL